MPSPAPPTPPRPRRARRWPALALALPALLLVAAAGVAWQSLHTETGTRWWVERVAARLPGVSAGTSSGALLGADARFRLDRLAIELGRQRIRIDALALDGLTLSEPRLTAPHGLLSARGLSAQQVAIEPLPAAAPPEPAAKPARLRLPVALRVEQLAVERLSVAGLAAPIEQLRARLEAGAVHRIEALTLRWQGVRLRGDATLGADAPLPLQAALTARTEDAGTDAVLPAWARALTLELQARGTLALIDTRARLAMQDQQLDLQAQVAPFDRLPLPQLEARFGRLDLARLLAPVLGAGRSAPTTALTGSARVQLSARQPLLLHLAAQNAAPGPWDAGRLPLREADLLLRGRGGAWEVERAALQFAGDERTPAGRLSAAGRFDGLDHGTLAALGGALTLNLDGLRPDLLDRRGPALRLSGPLTLQHAPAAAAGAAFGTLAVEARLDGALQGAAR
ncbi:MAG TPA: hypothetical protein VLI72_14625, partial [Methylibium sp.]|nr:hypothetical protein [Methylibium sp.]